ncbi:MAG: hypothetical protein AAB618_01155 [Patescibacteria group bacterium]
MYEAQEKELSIDTPEGLQEFLRFIEDVYRDFIVVMQQTPGSEVLVDGDLLKVEVARNKAVELVAHHTKILEFGGELYEEDITQLQALYDSIVSVYDRLVKTTYQVANKEEAQTVIADTSGLDATLDRAKLLAVQADQLVYEFSELETVQVTTAELKLGKLLYEQLKLTAKQALDKVGEIEQFTVTTSQQELLPVAARLDRELDTITNNLEQLRKSLARYFETEAFAEETPERKNAQEKIKKDERAAKLFDQQSIFTVALKSLLKEERNRVILQERHNSPAAFEASLKREVYRVEAPSKLDALLGIKYASAFVFLKDMTLMQIDQFESQSKREDIRLTLQEKNIPYETYMAWIQALPYMEAVVDTYDDMTFLELFIRSEIKMLSEELEARRNAQGVHNK